MCVHHTYIQENARSFKRIKHFVGGVCIRVNVLCKKKRITTTTDRYTMSPISRVVAAVLSILALIHMLHYDFGDLEV